MTRKTKRAVKQAHQYSGMKDSCSKCYSFSGIFHPAPRSALTAASIIFGIIALVHAYRVVQGFPVLVDGFAIPVGFSAVLVVVAGALSFLCCAARPKG
ncbi:hypothetical protein HYU19_04545 [Candidatus Woesearchaeota archaeon]|nr:hypothetical protein [Candidatus Woesearchaeota archaeon]